MSRLKNLIAQFSEKKAAAPAAQQIDEAAVVALRTAAALTEYIYKPDNHLNVTTWLETSKAFDMTLGSENLVMQEVPLQGPRRQSEEQFRGSWNSHRLDVEIPEAVIDVGFDQLWAEGALGAVAEPLYRNDSALSLHEDFTRPNDAWKSDVNKARIWELSAQWETHEGMLRDMVDEHTASCRKCWHEDCWE